MGISKPKFSEIKLGAISIVSLIFLGLSVRQGYGYTTAIHGHGLDSMFGRSLPPMCPADIFAPECVGHNECSDSLSCFVDYKCHDPCTESEHGLNCVANAVCRAFDHTPTCFCRDGFEGNGTVRCYPKYPEPPAPEPEPVRKEGECMTHTDCPDHLACFVDRKCRDICKEARHDITCDICVVINHEPTCGDPPAPGSDQAPPAPPPTTTLPPRPRPRPAAAAARWRRPSA